MEKLAKNGGIPALRQDPADRELFRWPIITQEDEAAALAVIRENSFSGTDVTERFEEEFAAWQNRRYAVGYCNGTASLAAAMFAVGLSRGDEIICTTKTYWASIAPALIFGAVPVFCNVDDHLSMDPDDLERCVTPQTKAIMVVHYLAYPCDMDRIMAIAKKHSLAVIEDVSHAQGGLYKGKKLGTFGIVAAMSLMSTKSFAAGEMGMLVTDDRRVYERAVAYGHYERNNDRYIIESEDLKPYVHIALGGIKGRVNQLCAAIGRVQLKYYDTRCADIRRAMNSFWDRLEGLPGIRPIRVDESTGSNMAGWYCPHGRFYPEELHGLSAKAFCEAVRAEGVENCWDGANYCLHTHPLFHTFDLFGDGKPTRIAFASRDVRLFDKYCKPSETKYCFSVPWFKKAELWRIEAYADTFRKVIENHEQLLNEREGEKPSGRWYGFENTN